MAYIQLGEICDVIKGNIGITKAIPGDYPMVTTGEFRKSHNEFQLDTKAVLVPLVSATGHGHASIKRVHYQEGKFAFGSILAACVPKDKNYSAKFLYIYFSLMKNYVLVPLMKGSANVSLTLGNLKKAKVPDISLEIQLKIVELYSEIKVEQNKAIELITKQKNDISSLKLAILEEAILGKLTQDWRVNNPNTEDASHLLKRIQEEKARLVKDKKIKKEKVLPPITNKEIPYKLPKGWVWCRLGNYTHNFGQKKPDKNFEYIDVASIDNHLGVIKTELNIITPKDAPSRARKIVKKGCIIYSTVRPYLLNIACVDKEFENEAIASTAFSILNPILGCSPKYLYHLLRSPYFIEYVAAYSKGVAYPAINDKNLMSSPIALPPIDEQKAIVEKVNELMDLCDALEKEVQQSQEHSEQLMQSVLREVFERKKSN